MGPETETAFDLCRRAEAACTEARELVAPLRATVALIQARTGIAPLALLDEFASKHCGL